MTTTFWFILSLLTTLVYASENFTNVCKQLTSDMVKVSSIGVASSQQSFILLVDTMIYTKAHLNSLTISRSSSSDAKFECKLNLKSSSQVEQMVASREELEYAFKDMVEQGNKYGYYWNYNINTITIDRVDYFTVFLVLRRTYLLFSKIDVNGTVSDDFKMGRIEHDFTGISVLSSITPSVLYVLVGGNGCLTRIKLKDGQLERAPKFTLQKLLSEIGKGIIAILWSAARVRLDSHSFLNSLPTLNIENSTTTLCINGPQSIDGGHYDDKVDVLMGYNNAHKKLYIFGDLQHKPNTPPVKALNWSQFLTCPEGGMVALPKTESKPGNTMQHWLTEALFIVLVIVAIGLAFVLVKQFMKNKNKKKRAKGKAKLKNEVAIATSTMSGTTEMSGLVDHKEDDQKKEEQENNRNTERQEDQSDNDK